MKISTLRSLRLQADSAPCAAACSSLRTTVAEYARSADCSDREALAHILARVNAREKTLGCSLQPASTTYGAEIKAHVGSRESLYTLFRKALIGS